MSNDGSTQTAQAVRVSDDNLSTQLVAKVDQIVQDAEGATKPLEIDPFRGQLFELFVTAEGAGYVDGEGDFDLSADGLCHELSERWGLKQAAEQSFSQQSNLPPDQLKKMRSLWSLMRMWMEWAYAWGRWNEFHAESTK